jgi:hypothetical protein
MVASCEYSNEALSCIVTIQPLKKFQNYMDDDDNDDN